MRIWFFFFFSFSKQLSIASLLGDGRKNDENIHMSIEKEDDSIKEKHCSSHSFLLITLLFSLNNEGENLGRSTCGAACSDKAYWEAWPHAQVV